MDNIDNACMNDRIENLKKSYRHPPYDLERKLVRYLQQMDETNSRAVLDEINHMERARLADTPLRSVKNSLIGSCTLFTRAAIEAGANPEKCFMLSDALIQQIETCTAVAQTEALELEMLQKFIELLRKDKLFQYSPVVNRAISYIFETIQQRVTLGQIAQFCGVHPNYLSTLFKKEVGLSCSQFIQRQKAEAIDLLLKETNLSLTDIAATFGFSSASNFSGYFKKISGVSPLQYRKTKPKY